MRRPVLALLAAAGLAAGGTALAQQETQDPYVTPEPKVRSGDVLDVASAARCRTNRLLPIRFTPPFGAVFGHFEVRVRHRRAARLTGIPRAASVTIRLPRGTSRVQVTGETLGGQSVRSVRTYRVCEPEPAPPPPDEPPLTYGGGED
jgi:hypothetical protein